MIFKLIKLIIKEPIFILLSALLGFLTIESSVGLMALSALLISDAALRFSVADLMLPIVGVRFFGISRAVFRYAERYVSHSTTFRILRQVRVWFYNKLEPLVPWKTGGLHSGDLFSRMVGDVESLKEFYLRVFNPPVVAVSVMVFSSILLAFIDRLLAVELIICFAFGGFVIPYLAGVVGRKSASMAAILKSKINIQLLDTFSGISEIVIFNLENTYRKNLDNLSKNFLHSQKKLAVLNGFSSAAISLSGGVSMWLALLICIPIVNSGYLRGDFLAMIALGILSCFEAIQAMGPFFHRLEESKSAAARLFDIVEETETPAQPRNIAAVPEDTSITAMNLCMLYSSDRPLALDNISFKIPKGKKIAIVGSNGSGKSSLIQAITGALAFEGGEIFIGDVNIKDLSTEQLMDIYSVVPQNPYIFNSTLAENLKIADLSAPNEMLLKVLQEACLTDLVSSLPDGLNTYIGEGGHKLSGGQRQRLAIARALLRDRPILILDEPFTGLDPVTEEKLYNALQKKWSKKSVIFITHDLTRLNCMDEIIVMSSGHIIEHGTHDELLNLKGLYWKMWHRQTLENS